LDVAFELRPLVEGIVSHVALLICSLIIICIIILLGLEAKRHLGVLVKVVSTSIAPFFIGVSFQELVVQGASACLLALKVVLLQMIDRLDEVIVKIQPV
jgi:hypothetical protein